MPARVEFDSATRYSLRQLAAFFNAAYEGYAHPVATTPELLARRLREESIDLSISAVMEVDGDPAGLFLVARRGALAWCGGFGLNQPVRRRGWSKPLVNEMIARARASGATAFQLEVLHANHIARAVYAQAGFAITRDLCVFSSDVESESPMVGSQALRRADPAFHLARASAAESAPAAWQRSLASLAVRTEVDAYQTEDGRGGVLISRMHDGTGRVMSILGEPSRELGRLLRDVQSTVTRLLVINEPAGSRYCDLLRSSGFVELTRQYEMSLTLA